MLTELPDSILRRLPPGLSPVQLVCIDVVCHSADIVTLSRERLRDTLTGIALEQRPTALQITSAFADAWSIVDAVDRIRSMSRLLFKNVDPSFRELAQEFDDSTQSVRELRNLTDHLPQRIQQVVASNMPAIGRLSWVTIKSTRSALVCVLDPGTARAQKKAMAIPPVGGMRIQVPTGAMLLSAGNSKASLDDAALSVGRLVAGLEESLEQFIAANRLSGIESARDFTLFGEVSFPEELAVDVETNQLPLF